MVKNVITVLRMAKLDFIHWDADVLSDEYCNKYEIYVWFSPLGAKMIGKKLYMKSVMIIGDGQC